MITDNDRREVAERMRLYDVSEFKESAIVPFLDCLGAGYLNWREVLDSLADLIEPEPERTCQMDKSEFADFAPEYEGLYSCHKCGEETAVLACVNEGGDMEWIKPMFCGFCGAKVVEVVEE